MTKRAWYLVLAASVAALGLAACEAELSIEAGSGNFKNPPKKETTPTPADPDPSDTAAVCVAGCYTAACGTEMTTCKDDEVCSEAWDCALACPDEGYAECAEGCVDTSYSNEFIEMMDCFGTKQTAIDTCLSGCEEGDPSPVDPTCDEYVATACSAQYAACDAEEDCLGTYECIVDECDSIEDDDEYAECADDCINSYFSEHYEALETCIGTAQAGYPGCK